MKKRLYILTLIVIFIPAYILLLSDKKMNRYPEAWEKIEMLSKQYRQNEALLIADSIYKEALAKKNYEQLIKALTFQVSTIGTLDTETVDEVDDSYENANAVIKALKDNAKTLPQPEKSIVYSMIGQLYEIYYDRKIEVLDQCVSVPGNPDDIHTLSMPALAEEAARYYRLSLQEKEMLQKRSMDSYKEILKRGYDLNNQPSLYDLLARRALAFYASSFNVYLLDSSLFPVNDPDYFADVRTFVRLNIQPADTLSPAYLSLKTYQDLLRFHLDKSNYGSPFRKTNQYIAALVDADIHRISYLREKGRYADNEKMYEKALIDMSQQYKSYDCNAKVLLTLADYYYTRGEAWKDYKQEEYRSGYAQAYALCEQIEKDYPEQLAEYVTELKQKIKVRKLEVKVENVQLPEQPFLALVKFRNIDTLYQTVYSLSMQEAVKYMENSYTPLLQFVWSLRRTPMSKKQLILPSQSDFQQYTTEVKIDPFRKGFYLVIFSDTETSLNPSRTNAAMVIQVSSLMAQERTVNYVSTIMVTNRETGAPFSGAKVTYVSDNETIPPFFSNKDGLARCMNNNPGYTDYYKVEHEDDSLLVIDSSYGRDVRDEGIKNHAVLFTDRSIYRPGQTGYFKAILFETSKSNQKKLLTGTSVNMRLLDGNWQVIWEKSFVTNEFGSINGSFDIPQHLLNGRMILECDRYGHEEIRVEEYKRPTFTVTFDPVGGNIRLNEKAKVTANVKALAGYTVDHADVRYRVVRHIHSYSYYVGRLYLPYRQMQREVGSGIMTTDDNGNFSVEFETWADDTQDDRKVYTYYVTADVTDVNGETRSASVDVHVGNYPLLINTNLTDQILVGQLNDYTIETTNLNGDFTPAAVKVEIVRLKSPEKILRKRIWEDQVDLQAISEDEFRRDFPFDAYGDELNPSVLEDLEIVAQYDIHVDAKKKLDFSSLQHPGYYRIKLVADNQLGVVTDKTLYTYLAGDRSVPIPDMTKWLTVVKNSGEPGEQVEIHIAGGEENTSLYYELIHRNRIVESKWMKVGKKPEKICYTIKEEHRGGFDLQFNMVRHNRLYSENVKITVPFTDKMLDVNLVTFRDQLLPGQNETWTMKVSNKQGRGELAEIVASLYDASLDQIRPHHWIEMSSVYSQENFFWWPYGWNFEVINNLAKVRANAVNLPQQKARPASFTDINWFDDYWYAIAVHSGHGYVTYHSEEKADLAVSEDYDFDVDYDLPPPPPPPEPEPGTLGREMIHAKGGVREDNRDLVQIVARNNFDETAFFYPALRTNEKGEALIEFTMPEALTRWKLLSFAHTKDLKIGTYSNELVTRKQVAISANPPRFFRESDVIELTAKVNNLTDDELDGQALLRLYDAATMQSIDTFIRSEKTPRFRMNAGGSTGLRWTLTIPEGIQAIVYKVTVQSGMHTDGEEKTIPVLKNSILVTETLPFTVRAGKEKTLNFDHFVNNQSNTLRNHSLTLEYTSAPAWYAVQALPYLMEYPYECAEQTFSRYYANALASAVLDKTPRIRAIFDRWGKQGSEAFMSDLEKNRELKQVMLEEAPWVLQAKSESERKKRVGLLFEFNRMGSEQSRVFGLLRKMQNEDDGFPWFKNNPSNRFITQQIVSGMAHLEKLGAIQLDRYGSIGKMARRSLRYLDAEIRKDYNALVKNKVDLEKKHVGSIQLHYLYACSFTGHQPKNGDEMEAFDYYLQQAGQFWKEFTTYEKAMTALILHRNDQPEKAMEIIRSLKEYAQQSEEMGMYWKDNVAGYWWYQAPIETQAMLIEAFNEVAKDEEAVEEMKIWLLRNKQTNDWKTTKATSEAIYALLMTGGSLLDESKLLEVEIAGKPLAEVAKEPIKPEAGTGYVKTSWQSDDITPQMGTLKVKNPNNKDIAWGGMYWQYFEQLDKITSAETNLKMNKQLFLRTLTKKGEELQPINETNRLKVGDLVRVRMELRADRDYEYVHLKDMRASAFEPVSTLSGHRYQDGLWYYESVKDASTNFFITYLRKGMYVFEYDLRVSHVGDFSNGITTFQCMYAPEFSSHSEGIRVTVTAEGK